MVWWGLRCTSQVPPFDGKAPAPSCWPSEGAAQCFPDSSLPRAAIIYHGGKHLRQKKKQQKRIPLVLEGRSLGSRTSRALLPLTALGEVLSLHHPASGGPRCFLACG